MLSESTIFSHQRAAASPRPSPFWLPDTTINDARLVVDRVRAAFGDAPIRHDNVEIMATASAGISISHVQGIVLDRLMSAADSALYAAKKAGRNRTSILHAVAPTDRDAAPIVRSSS
ncbi:GGDEF domain-containing protein [Bradyrhizobium sp. USDA 10063]